MITEKELDGMITVDSAIYREMARKMRERADLLDCMVSKDISERRSPAQTYERFAEAVGQKEAQHLIASLVNEYAWDGRIDPRNASWAASVESAFDHGAMRRMSVFARMHMSHLDQIADEARKASNN